MQINTSLLFPEKGLCWLALHRKIKWLFFTLIVLAQLWVQHLLRTVNTKIQICNWAKWALAAFPELLNTEKERRDRNVKRNHSSLPPEPYLSLSSLEDFSGQEKVSSICQCLLPVQSCPEAPQDVVCLPTAAAAYQQPWLEATPALHGHYFLCRVSELGKTRSFFQGLIFAAGDCKVISSPIWSHLQHTNWGFFK